MLLQRLSKQPVERWRYTINYAPRLKGSSVERVDPPVEFAITRLDDGVDATPLEVVNSFLEADGSKLTLLIGGGDDGGSYKLSITVTTNYGQVWQDELEVLVEEI